MINSLAEFIEEFKRISDMGWIKTHRTGNTGIGKTLEDLLGIPENNAHAPDFGEYELKSKRIGTPSMLTLFTKSPQPRRANNYLLNKYGYVGNTYENPAEKALHVTLTSSRYVKIGPTDRSLIIKHNESKIWIASDIEDENVYWDKEELKKAFEQKYLGKFVYTYAECRGGGANEEFWFKEAYEVSGFSYEDFVQLLLKGKIFIDIRIGRYHDGAKRDRVHDHGTAFRIREDDEKDLFKNKRKIV